MCIGKFSFGWFMLATCCILLLVSGASADSSPQNADSPLGANLHVLADWSSEYTFVDAFKQSRPWMTQADGVWDTKEADLLDLDENGWPKSLPDYDDWTVKYRWISTLMFNGISGRYPSGQYIVLYDGKGTIEYGLDASKNSASRQGRDVIDVVAGKTQAGFSLSIKATDPFGTGDYIRNVRVLMPGFDETNYQGQTFHPTFLSNISKYKVIRFMDWMRTNWDYNETGPIRDLNEHELEWSHPLHDAEDNPFLRRAELEAVRSAETIGWSDRPEPTDSTFASEEGVPVELMVELANEIKADPWFNMPHLATDEYIEEFARTVHQSLDPQRRVYVEYSNEVWNSGFGQSRWVERQATAQWPDSTVSDLEKRLSWFGERTATMCDIWKAVYSSTPERVVCVMGTQASNSWLGERTLDCPLSTMAPCHTHIDAVAIAPYFGQHIGDPVNRTGVEEWTGRWDGGMGTLFNELRYGSQLTGGAISKTSLHEAKQYMDAYAEVAAERNIGMVAYEGGQHLAGVGSVTWNNSISEMFSLANRDSRMTDLYTDYLEHWDNAGGQIFVIFTSSGVYSRWGNWGAHEYADEVNTPKHGAVTEFIAENSCDWDQCLPVPSSVPTAVTLHSVGFTIVSSSWFALLVLGLLTMTWRVLRPRVE